MYGYQAFSALLGRDIPLDTAQIMIEVALQLQRSALQLLPHTFQVSADDNATCLCELLQVPDSPLELRCTSTTICIELRTCAYFPQSMLACDLSLFRAVWLGFLTHHLSIGPHTFIVNDELLYLHPTLSTITSCHVRNTDRSSLAGKSDAMLPNRSSEDISPFILSSRLADHQHVDRVAESGDRSPRRQ